MILRSSSCLNKVTLRLGDGSIHLVAARFDDAVAWLLGAAAEESPRAVRLVNAYSIACATIMPRYLATLQTSASVNLPDGKILAWYLRCVHSESCEQIRGPRLFERTVDLSQGGPTRHFLLGSTPDVLDKLEGKLSARYPRGQIVGKYSPPFSPTTLDGEARVQESLIRAALPCIIWVALGTPKQDLVATDLANRYQTVVVGVGAAFEFSAGTKRQAPPWMQALGLEWVHRLSTEPRRLWKRYLFGNARFLRVLARDASSRSWASCSSRLLRRINHLTAAREK